MTKCGFSLVDLQNMINIIEVCTKRGAFNAEEMSGVGTLYDKLKKANSQHSNLETNKRCEEGECKTGDCEEGECKVVDEQKKTCCLDGVCPIDKDCERVDDE